jgi:methyl-accepting chemotaxis protein
LHFWAEAFPKWQEVEEGPGGQEDWRDWKVAASIDRVLEGATKIEQLMTEVEKAIVEFQKGNEQIASNCCPRGQQGC